MESHKTYFKEKKKKISVSKQKKKAWKACSLYIRARDCLETTGTLDYGRCFTCDIVQAFKQSQAGHFIPGREGWTLYDERGIHLQCMQCNVFKHGNTVEYWQRMEKKYGRELIEELLKRDKETKQYKLIDHIEMEQYFMEKYRKLIESKV